MRIEQDLSGKLRNIQLGRSKALLPAFEVVVNAFQAIEEAGGSSAEHEIRIVITRELVLDLEGAQGRVKDVTVTDTGVGFTEPNMRSFLTSDSRYKSAKGGKGLGRFLWLKAFDRAEVDSVYREGNSDHLWRRHFRFTLTEGHEDSNVPTSTGETVSRTTVALIGMKPGYQEHCPKDLVLIGHLLVEHCLPYFMQPDRPRVTIRDEEETIDLNQYFADAFAAVQTNHAFKVGPHEFTLKGLRLTNPHDNAHRLVYAADRREVIAEKLERFIPNLKQKRLVATDDTKFVYLGWVEGPYLDEHPNQERTQFSFPVEGTSGDFTEDVTLAEIREAAIKCVNEDLAAFLEAINAAKRAVIDAFVIEEPEYRPMVRYMAEFIDRIPPGASPRDLDAALHEQMFHKRRQLKREGQELMDASDRQALAPEDYDAKLESFLERSGEMGMAALARYVAHRRVMLGFLEKSLGANPDTGKHELEKVIHKIIYPMRSTSEAVPYERQNLWIIDERLAYHGFLASDMPLDKIDVIANESDSRPDLLIFERALSFSEDSELHNSLVIVEFKKPDSFSRRNGHEDPVDQVYRLIKEIRGGQFYDQSHRRIAVAHDLIPAYAYVICDLTEQMNTVCQNKGFIPTPDRMGWFGYNPTLTTYVEVISYTKLLRDAKRRNRVLFERLNLPTNVSE
jgi:hypothetical protein